MLEWFIANRDFLWGAVVVALFVYGVLFRPKLEKPPVEPLQEPLKDTIDGSVPDASGEGPAFDPVPVAEMAVRAARAMYDTADMDRDAQNDLRAEYAINRLLEFFPWLDANQAETLVEGAWDKVKENGTAILLPEGGEIELTIEDDNMPLSWQS